MGKLHELLAVEGDLSGIAKTIIEETSHVFKKSELFTGSHRKLQMFDAAEQERVVADEYREQVTTVPAKLSYLAGKVAPFYDAVLQKEKTNQAAVADLEVDGITLGTNIPATFLLGMESKLKDLRAVYVAIPTLAPGIAWEKDQTLDNSYRMKVPDEKLKTAKTFMYKVLYEATDKHPAQIEKWEEQAAVGKYVTNVTSGMLSPAEKSALLGRLDKLIQAVKKARVQANMVEVVPESIGDKLFRYLHGEK